MSVHFYSVKRLDSVFRMGCFEVNVIPGCPMNNTFIDVSEPELY